ncbi:hypothetical protein ABW21_db0202652 [Orbilia brochopaga]|nr:hypothetical protein ABW21_db0202652 [Drechslerella brochopaga]
MPARVYKLSITATFEDHVSGSSTKTPLNQVSAINPQSSRTYSLIDMMLFKKFFIASSFAHAALAASCNADNCLRALRATQTPGRAAEASADCSAYFAIPTVTYTQTLTFSETSTTNTLITETATVDLTATTVLEETSTTTLDIGVTATVTTFIPIKKRQDVALPGYATACAGTVRFSSACSCISVSSPTVTPSTTVTISTTLYFTTTQTDVELATVSTVVSTETQTDLDVVTKTVGSIATTTIKPFKIQASFDTNPANDKYLYPFARFAGSNPVLYTGFANTAEAGATYVIDGTTIKTISGDVLSCQTGPDWAWVYGQAISGGSIPCVCNIDPTSKAITCSGAQNSVLAQWDLRLTIAKSVESMWGSFRLVNLKAIPAIPAI